MPSTVERLSRIHLSMPMMTWGICEVYSRVETMDTRPPRFSATLTSPGVQAPGARVSHPGGGLWGGKQRKEVEQFLKWGTAPNPVEVARVAGFDGWFWFG